MLDDASDDAVLERCETRACGVCGIGVVLRSVWCSYLNLLVMRVVNDIVPGRTFNDTCGAALLRIAHGRRVRVPVGRQIDFGGMDVAGQYEF